jgi:hypothetical protein
MNSKIRMAEKAFIYFMLVKNNSRAGFTLQIFLISFMGRKQIFIEVIFELKLHNTFLSEINGSKESRIH